MIRLEIASGHFVQHRREHREIFAADEGHFDVLALCGRVVEVPSSFDAREASPENDNALFGSGAIYFHSVCPLLDARGFDSWHS